MRKFDWISITMLVLLLMGTSTIIAAEKAEEKKDEAKKEEVKKDDEEKKEEIDPKVTKLLAKLTKGIDEAEKASDKAKAYAKEKLLPLCTNKVFVKAVKEQNAKEVSLDEIKKIDKQWIEAEEPLEIHGKLMGNKCAKLIKKLAKENAAINEAFVMDNKGANVGQNALTSDYWQGDEAKFKNSFKKGKGGVDVGKVKFDKSADTELQQISLPIIDKDGTVIGAVTFGLVVSKYE